MGVGKQMGVGAGGRGGRGEVQVQFRVLMVVLVLVVLGPWWWAISTCAALAGCTWNMSTSG